MKPERPFPYFKTPPISPQKSEKFQKYHHIPIRPDTSSRQIENNQHKLVNLIGYDRLLSSMDKLSPIVATWCKPQTKVNDRFIPHRKMAVSNYSIKNNIDNQENYDEDDPQCISITEIYSEEILSIHNKYELEEINPFRNKNILQFQQKIEKQPCHEYDSPLNIFTTSSSQRVRKISKVPCKVLDAPALQDDFYLNLIDWSSNNHLAVGLGNCIYLWDAETSKVTRLCQLNNDIVTSVSWAIDGRQLAVGCNKGEVLIWDIDCNKESRKMAGHQIRVGAMAWNSTLLATGSRDKNVLLRDVRSRKDFISKMAEHSQQICGLKWSHDEQYLASGGNDNKVAVWSNGGQLINKFADHVAAVKAISWSPQQHGLLATGGGTADRMLRMRNIFTGKIVAEKDTGSQICNLAFSKNLHEIVSTHGYSQNEINIWSYPKMRKVATLVGHTHRVLYLSMSPDGSTIVTGAGDETLRFWNIFPSGQREHANEEVKSSMIEEGLSLR